MPIWLAGNRADQISHHAPAGREVENIGTLNGRVDQQEEWGDELSPCSVVTQPDLALFGGHVVRGKRGGLTERERVEEGPARPLQGLPHVLYPSPFAPLRAYPLGCGVETRTAARIRYASGFTTRPRCLPDTCRLSPCGSGHIRQSMNCQNMGHCKGLVREKQPAEHRRIGQRRYRPDGMCG